MLYTDAVETRTLELLRSLQGKEYLKGFYLAGGTALALYYGHRKSIDLHFFSNFEFSVLDMIESLQQDFPLQLFNTAENTIKGAIKNINIDIIAHRYEYLDIPLETDGIGLLSEPDILAMKLNAISISGQRTKDYIDIYFALIDNKYSLTEILSFYKMKYKQDSDMHVIKSLIYFEDIDLGDWPVLIRNKKIRWEDIKQFLEKEVQIYINSGE